MPVVGTAFFALFVDREPEEGQMSMSLELLKIEVSVAESLRRERAVGDALFFGRGKTPPSFRRKRDALALDYEMLSGGIEARESEGLDCAWTRRAFGEGFGTRLELGLAYGPAWLLMPEEVRALAAGLKREAWDEDEHPILVRFLATAAREGRAVVGGVT